MSIKIVRKQRRKLSNREFARMLKTTMEEARMTARREGELSNAQDPEQAGIFLAACRIVISGYRAEISRSENNSLGGNSLYVRAAYELLHHFLQEQFAPRPRAA